MHWINAIAQLRANGEAAVLVTVIETRGHAPQSPGAKMVVTADRTWGTVGGGNLEATAVQQAREQLSKADASTSTMRFDLNEHATTEHGTQCCGGVVTVLFEALRPPPSIAVFGLGHVGVELAALLARHDVRLHLVDSRASHAVWPAAIAPDPTADIVLHHAPVPEVTLGELPAGTHVVILTHDHSEDAALCDMALRCRHLGSVGLIGSTAKWRRFEKRLQEEGHSPEAVAGIRSPLGDRSVAGKDPAVVAVSIAAELLRITESERAPVGATR